MVNEARDEWFKFKKKKKKSEMSYGCVKKKYRQAGGRGAIVSVISLSFPSPRMSFYT
jgi:hypothetical protein